MTSNCMIYLGPQALKPEAKTVAVITEDDPPGNDFFYFQTRDNSSPSWRILSLTLTIRFCRSGL